MQDEIFAIHLSPVTNAFDFQNTFKTSTDTLNHICKDRTGGSMQSTFGGLVGFTGYYDLAILHCNPNQGGERPLHFTFRTFYTYIRATDVHLHTGRDDHGHTSNSRHFNSPLYQTLQRISPPTPNWRAR